MPITPLILLLSIQLVGAAMLPAPKITFTKTNCSARCDMQVSVSGASKGATYELVSIYKVGSWATNRTTRFRSSQVKVKDFVECARYYFKLRYKTSSGKFSPYSAEKSLLIGQCGPNFQWYIRAGGGCENRTSEPLYISMGSSSCASGVPSVVSKSQAKPWIVSLQERLIEGGDPFKAPTSLSEERFQLMVTVNSTVCGTLLGVENSCDGGFAKKNTLNPVTLWRFERGYFAGSKLIARVRGGCNRVLGAEYTVCSNKATLHKTNPPSPSGSGSSQKYGSPAQVAFEAKKAYDLITFQGAPAGSPILASSIKCRTQPTEMIKSKVCACTYTAEMAPLAASSSMKLNFTTSYILVNGSMVYYGNKRCEYSSKTDPSGYFMYSFPPTTNTKGNTVFKSITQSYQVYDDAYGGGSGTSVSICDAVKNNQGKCVPLQFDLSVVAQGRVPPGLLTGTAIHSPGFSGKTMACVDSTAIVQDAYAKCK